MVAVLAGERELLEQRLLERPQLDLDRAEEQRRPTATVCCALGELVRVVGDEVAARPVALEDRRHLRDGIRIPRARDADVPLEPASPAR